MATNFVPSNSNNEQTLIARAGADAEPNAEHEVANIRFVVTRSWKSDDADAVNGFKSEDAWYSAACWKNAANRAAEIRKGDIIEVNFHAADLKADAFMGKDGQPAASLKIARATARVILPKNGSNEGYQPEPASQDVAL